MTEPEAVSLAELSDLGTPWCLHVVATLRIADHIAAGTADTVSLAAATASDADFLQRVLRHLVGKGVFEEPSPGGSRSTTAARGCSTRRSALGLDLNAFGGRMAARVEHAAHGREDRRPAYHELFGLPFWEDLEAHPDIAASFDALMGPAGHGPPDPDVLVSGGWDSVRTVVDVGGGTGALLAEILRARPAIRGTPGRPAADDGVARAETSSMRPA